MATYLECLSHSEIVTQAAFLLILHGMDNFEILLVEVPWAMPEMLTDSGIFPNLFVYSTLVFVPPSFT